MRKLWTPAEDALLCAMYPHCHTADVGAWVGRTQGQCYQHAAKLGLRKDADYLASDTACRVSRSRRTPGMIANQFKPGLSPWNKGTKGIVGVQEACRATQFKKGAKPHTWVPVGTYRVSSESVLEQKLTDLPGPNTVRWFPVHRSLWQAAHGEIPAGHVVRFKPGQKTTVLEEITLDRLECVTRVENMRRNSVHTNYPPEIARLVQLRGALHRQINKAQKALEEA